MTFDYRDEIRSDNQEDQVICLCGEVGDGTHWIIQTTQGWKCVKK